MSTNNGLPKQELPDTFTAAELLAADIPPVEFLIKDFLPVGLAMLASPPKGGKSFLCMDLAISLASGGEFLGFECSQCGVIYCALEDSFGRLKGRLMDVLNGRQAPKDFILKNEARTLDDGLPEQVKEWLAEYPATKLIIFDTLKLIRPRTGKRAKGANAYDVDYEELADLKRIADANEICILVVHHLNKAHKNLDAFTAISGTYGLLGALDTSICLSAVGDWDTQGQVDKQATMAITGRDVEIQSYSLTFHSDTKRWGNNGTVAATQQSERRKQEEAAFCGSPITQTIGALLLECGGEWEGTCEQLLEAGKRITGEKIAKNATAVGTFLSEANKYKRFERFTDMVYTDKGRNETGAKRLKRFTLARELGWDDEIEAPGETGLSHETPHETRTADGAQGVDAEQARQNAIRNRDWKSVPF